MIEPDEFLASIYEKNLEMEDFQVTRIINPERAFKLASTKKFHAIILEISLPQGDGFDLLKIFKEDKQTKNIPVIVLTKLGGKNEIMKIWQYGADDFLIKQHFKPSEVVDKLKRILAK